MSFLETVHRVIDLARQTRMYYDAELPKFHPDYPLVRESESPPPPTEAELRGFLEALPGDDLYRLIALSRVFWGELKGSDFQALRDDQERLHPGRNEAIDWLMINVPLADQLEDGLEEVAKRNIELGDRLVEQVPARG